MTWVGVRNTSNTVLKTLASYSNLNKGTAYVQRTFDLIVRSLVLCVQRAVPLMKGREGAIVTIGGQGTVECLPNYALLAAAKGAMETWRPKVMATPHRPNTPDFRHSRTPRHTFPRR